MMKHAITTLVLICIGILTCGSSCNITGLGAVEHDAAPPEDVGSRVIVTVSGFGTAADIIATRLGSGLDDLDGLAEIYRLKLAAAKVPDGKKVVVVRRPGVNSVCACDNQQAVPLNAATLKRYGLSAKIIGVCANCIGYIHKPDDREVARGGPGG